MLDNLLSVSSLSTFLWAGLLLAAIFFVFRWHKSEWIIYLLLVWFPLENVILRYTPLDYYALVKYLPEFLLYVTVLFSGLKRLFADSEKKLPRNPVLVWLGIYLLVALASWLMNKYDFTVWLLGVRQVLRFAAVFLLVWWERYDLAQIKKIALVGGAVIGFEALLGVLQFLSGGALDRYLFFTQTVNISGAELEGLEQFWVPGQRVFATLGRYDRLGSFLVLGLISVFPWFYYLRNRRQQWWYWITVVLLLLAIILTYSRASWLALIIGIGLAGYYALRDARIVKVGLAAVLMLGVVLGLMVAARGFGSATVDQARQNVAERTLEALSWYSWRQSYDGFGRAFFIINTPLVVTRDSPLLGVGPGNYGGGVAAALRNTKVYDRLHLPFGIQNTYGQIDNSWWSILGETGLLGWLNWLGIFIELIIGAFFVFRHSRDQFKSILASGFIGVTAAVMVMGFFGPYFEFRAPMFYFWLLAGLVFACWREEKEKWNFIQ